MEIESRGSKYWVNEDNIEYIVKVGREWMVCFVSGRTLKVDGKTAKDLIGGYNAKKRKDVQPGPEADKV